MVHVMSEVKRYDCTNGKTQYCYGCYQMEEVDEGAWVRAIDFDAQRLRADTAEAELAKLRESHAALIEDRARFPDRPDFVGDMISAHIGNLKAGKESSDNYARNWSNKLTAAEQRIAELELSAARWKAFTNCARIRFFGSAGYEEKDPYGNSPGNYRHFGGEFWTMHDAPQRDFSSQENANRILNGFADAAIAALNPNPEAESHE